MSFLDALPDALSRQGAVRELAKGEPLFQQGQPTTAIFEVLRGRLRLVRRTADGHLVALHTARAGDLFAEAALFSDVYHCDALAAAPSRIRAFPKPVLLAALRADPALFEAFSAQLARQLQALRTRLELRNVRSARERVLQHLLLATSGDSRTILVDSPLQDVAAELGLTREAFYRTLAALEADGVIARTATGIELKKSSIV
jgi:CRP/FNR family transcriptional regulator, dissimilatory nitrate respiration regulator